MSPPRRRSGRRRKDLQYAVIIGTDTHRRRQYALSARDEAATVLAADDATAAQLRYARHYFHAAQRFAGGVWRGAPPRLHS